MLYTYTLIHLYTLLMNIWICPRDTNKWTPSTGHVTPAIRDAYVNYKERPHYYRETPYTEGEYIVYRPNNDVYLATYIARIDNVRAASEQEQQGQSININIVSQELHNRLDTATPIIDMNDIYAFIVDNQSMSRANWMPCREYQAWAYRDFIYDTHRSTKKSYMSRYSSYLAFTNTILANQIVTIDLPDLNPNIIFNVSRNENNSVYFERNDASGSRVRMCDNEYARAGYLGFYTRITMDPGIIVIPPPPDAGPTVYYNLLSTSHLPPPEETDDESLQCILCNNHQVNVKFSPCEHKISCSECYSKMTKNACPVCRSTISRLMNI
jgi:hypothetical protein